MISFASVLIFVTFLASQTLATMVPRSLRDHDFVKRDLPVNREVVGSSPTEMNGLFPRQTTQCAVNQVLCQHGGCCPSPWFGCAVSGCCRIRPGYICEGIPVGCTEINTLPCPAFIGGCCPIGQTCYRDAQGNAGCTPAVTTTTTTSTTYTSTSTSSSATTTTSSNVICPNGDTNCRAGCCPAGYTCYYYGAQNGCCKVGTTCSGPVGGGCAYANSTLCPPAIGGCCPNGQLCYRDSLGTARCDNIGIYSTTSSRSIALSYISLPGTNITTTTSTRTSTITTSTSTYPPVIAVRTSTFIPITASGEAFSPDLFPLISPPDPDATSSVLNGAVPLPPLMTNSASGTAETTAGANIAVTQPVTGPASIGSRAGMAMGMDVLMLTISGLVVIV